MTILTGPANERRRFNPKLRALFRTEPEESSHERRARGNAERGAKGGNRLRRWTREFVKIHAVAHDAHPLARYAHPLRIIFRASLAVVDERHLWVLCQSLIRRKIIWRIKEKV